MSEKDDGGPAFPVQTFYKDARHWSDGAEGMTLRDYFAGEALCGELSAQSRDFAWMDTTADALAVRCYLLADAMLKARAR